MQERYKKLFSLPNKLYSEESPVIIESGALHLDTKTNRVLAQIKLLSVTDKIIISAKISITQTESAMRQIGEPIIHTYLDLNVFKDQNFGSKTPIFMTDNNTRAFIVNVEECIFADKTIWSCKDTFSAIPTQKSIYNFLKTETAINYYISLYGKNANCVYAEYADLKLCTCGKINKNTENCTKCNCSLQELKNIDFADLYKKAEHIAEEERLEKERQAELEREFAIRKAKLNKKISLITIPTVCVIISLTILLTTVIIPYSKYNSAIKQLNAGNFVEAYESLIDLNGYKDSAEKAKLIYESDNYKIEKLKSARVGDYVFFGSYEQDNNLNNGKEYIEWLVLEIKENKALVISKYGLERMPFNNRRVAFNWDSSSIKNWLEESFLINSFSSKNKSSILNILLLDVYEVKKYFKTNSERKCTPTKYCNRNWGYNSWWVNSQGSWSTSAIDVSGDGVINDGTLPDRNGNYIDNCNAMVRPALWIDLSKLK